MKPSFVVLAFCLAALPVASHADPVPMSAGHLPMPREGTQVGILRENLSIDVRFDAMAVVAKLVLENRGAATTVPVGFPCYTQLDEDVVGLRCETELRVHHARHRPSSEARRRQLDPLHALEPNARRAGVIPAG